MLLLVVVGEVTLEGVEASTMKEKKKRTYRTATHRCSPRWLDHLCCAADDIGEAEVIIDGAHPDPLGI